MKYVFATLVYCWIAVSSLRAGGQVHAHLLTEDGAPLIGFDARGVPIRCGTGDEELIQVFAEGEARWQRWEIVPSVLRASSRDPFYIFVFPNRAVSSVRLVLPTSDVVKPENLDFHDDGLNGDEEAGDGVYTLGPFYLHENQSEMTFHPTVLSPGFLQVIDTGGSISTFAIEPTIGVLPADFDGNPVHVLGDEAQVTRNLLNVKRERLGFQEMLRGFAGSESWNYVKEVYKFVQDEYDEMFLMSSGKLELYAGRVNWNQNGGVHFGVQSQDIYDVTYDESRQWGSNGVLESLNVLDYQQRGMNPNNMMHEFLHRWGAYLSLSLGYKNDTGHYSPYSDANSLLGGYEWVAQGDGSFARKNGKQVYRASPVDLFSMGLLPLDELPDLHLSREIEFVGRETVLQAGDIVKTIASDDIRIAHAERMPDWESPKTHFRVLFVIESRDRLLTEEEMAFYAGFVGEAMRELEDGEPDPAMGGSWAPVTRFFGDRVTWDSRVKVKESLFASGLDHDRDGYESRLEASLGLDPFDDESKPWIRVKVTGGGEMVVEVYPYQEDGLVELQRSENLVEWVLVEGGEIVQEHLRYEVPENIAGFFRTRIDVPAVAQD
ncbi:choice-of-anchor X domain-containing protein [Pelagicoccus sp. SDUM812003]|uniref:choice-of-anchor X domain-containing protein n=1 Tax=Pelagicoccus sp. SDUM812003 TaxID=3041267 RepID=UPI00280E361F|nr:choice-of-anchor X domain-containing protein [Pelagicoccus sp. SDUM812003]MDQ8203361.1 hypothetical protein [Pelagicoccus sp. SDUM812003]